MPSRLSIAAVPAAAVAITVVTALNRSGLVTLNDLASSPRAVGEGHEWLLVTSAFVADRPAVPSIAGFVVVGLAALALCGARVLWVAACAGHLLGTVVVYAALDVAGVTVRIPDYGTSAVIAAWIGVIAYHVAVRRSGAAALAFCIVAALVGWLFRPDLDILDTEHAVALVVGLGAAAWLPRLVPPEAPRLLRQRRALQGRPLRHGSG